MRDDERKEALENIELIRELVMRTEKEMFYSGGGWISIIWGIFSIVGFIGQRILIHTLLSQGFGRPKVGSFIGIFWLVLSLIGLFATFMVVRGRTKSHSDRRKRLLVKEFFLFWFPLLLLAYTLAMFCSLIPGLSSKYIPIFILLVISTGFLIIGFLFNREILWMGILGYAGSILTAVFFLNEADIILGSLFGIGLILTGVLSNRRWRK